MLVLGTEKGMGRGMSGSDRGESRNIQQAGDREVVHGKRVEKEVIKEKKRSLIKSLRVGGKCDKGKKSNQTSTRKGAKI